MAGRTKKLYYGSGSATYTLTSGGKYTIYVALASLSDAVYDQAWAMQKYNGFMSIADQASDLRGTSVVSCTGATALSGF